MDIIFGIIFGGLALYLGIVGAIGNSVSGMDTLHRAEEREALKARGLRS